MTNREAHSISFQDAGPSTWLLSLLTISATIAAFCKQFTPLYHLHSTAIFVISALFSLLLVIPVWKHAPDSFSKARSAALVVICIWAYSALSYALFAHHNVPVTYLVGFVLFSGLFVLLGVAAAGAPRTLATIFAAIAVIYLIYLARYYMYLGFLFPPPPLVAHYGFPGGFGDIFDLSSDPHADRIDLFVTQYQNVGRFLALGALATLMLVGNRWPRGALGWIAVPISFALILWIGARGALLGLSTAISIWMFAGRHAAVKNRFLMLTVALLASGILLVVLNLKFGIEIPVIDRTIREIQHPDPRTRGPILEHLFSTLLNHPRSLLTGRGLGMFPVELGWGTPDWLIAKPAAGYPHNVILEALYELGIAGMALVVLLLLIPIGRAWANWSDLSPSQLFILQLYVFHLVALVVSGALVYSYDFYFVLGLALGALPIRDAKGINRPQAMLSI